MKRDHMLFVGLLALLLLGLVGWWWWNPTGNRQTAAPIVRGRPEGCLVCHAGMTGFSPHHAPEAIGCAACHRGNVFAAADKTTAHAGMLRVPGNLPQATSTCGTTDCHPVIAAQILGSLMATGRGLVAVDRFVFGEAPTPDEPGHLSQLTDSPADQHLAQLCATCHLGFPKDEPEPINELSRGGGCTACHLHYSPEAVSALAAYQDDPTKLPATHPALTVQVSDDHCFGCHSRSGRISLSYAGWHETLATNRLPTSPLATRTLQDGRTLVRSSEDVHHAAGMECVDCHTWRETMGDGVTHRHEEEAVELACEDCHFTDAPRTVGTNVLNDLERKLLQLRGWNETNPRFLVIGKTGHALLNSTFNVTGQPVLLGKNQRNAWPLKGPAATCGGAISGHDRLSCQSCHSAWAPQCIQCHTQLEPGATTGATAPETNGGIWMEYAGDFLAEPPALGVRAAGHRIEPFVPGMILTINPNREDRHENGSAHDRFLRLYAPLAPHTTAVKGRDCASCHAHPVALGYGRGKLEFRPTSPNTGRWTFEPAYKPHPADGLPLDAWIGFLAPSTGTNSTRLDARPFNVKEQRRILTVGVCLACHPFDQAGSKEIYSDFEAALRQRTPRCSQVSWSPLRQPASGPE